MSTKPAKPTLPHALVFFIHGAQDPENFAANGNAVVMHVRENKRRANRSLNTVSLVARSKRWKCLAGAIGNLEAWLDVAVDVHEAPFVFPFLALLVVADLPWLIER